MASLSQLPYWILLPPISSQRSARAPSQQEGRSFENPLPLDYVVPSYRVYFEAKISPSVKLLIRIRIVQEDRAEVQSCSQRTWLVDLDISPRDAEYLLVPTSFFLLRPLLHRRSLYSISHLCLQTPSERAARLGPCCWARFVVVSANQHLLGRHIHWGSRPDGEPGKGTIWG